MKKVLVLTLSAGLASAVLTSSVNASYLDNVGVYGSATYTRPSNNGLSIGEIQTVHPTSSEVYAYDRAVFLSPEFNWDYAIGVSFRFPCSDTRFFVEYDYFNDTDKRNVDGIAKYPVYPITQLSATRTALTDARANLMETSKEWRLGLRHFLPFSPRFFVDLSAFFEYDRVNISVHEWLTSSFTGTTTLSIPSITAAVGGNNSITTYYENNQKFSGWGPGAGVKLIGIPVACCPTISIFGGIMTSLLYAKNNDSDSLYGELLLGTGVPVYTQAIFYEHNPEFSQSLLTKIDINFGVDYRRMLCLAGEQFRSGVTVGVRYLNIFNAFKNGNNAGRAILRGQSNENSFFPVLGIPNDWGRVGPYLQFRVGGCDA